jgi:FtsZ-interacting cell division protein YlmF
MGARSFMDKVKNGLNIGAVHRWLFGENAQEQDWDSDAQYSSAQDEHSVYNYSEYGYAEQQQQYSPQPQYAPQQYAPPQQQQAHQYGQQDMQHYQLYPQANQYAQASYNPSYNTPRESDHTPPSFQSQFAPKGYTPEVQQKRNRRADQHRVEPQENLVQFPQENAVSRMDAYVINVSNVEACRQAMICLRKGQCTLIVMDQVIDRAEARRYVDMLTGACYALGGSMTRLSSKIGFYLMAPSGMTVYTDAVTSNANNPRQIPQSMNQPSFTQNRMPEVQPASFSSNAAYSGNSQYQDRNIEQYSPPTFGTGQAYYNYNDSQMAQ